MRKCVNAMNLYVTMFNTTSNIIIKNGHKKNLANKTTSLIKSPFLHNKKITMRSAIAFTVLFISNSAADTVDGIHSCDDYSGTDCSTCTAVEGCYYWPGKPK